MALHDIVTRWENWRVAVGRPNSRQREQVMQRLETRPALLYWGDSWFSTPLYLNLARQSMARIDGMAMLVGKPGGTAEGFFTANEIERVLDRLRNNPFDALCLSAGGNDALSDRLDAVFAPHRRDHPERRMAADDAFAILLRSKVFDRLHKRYRDLLVALKPLLRERPHFRVIGHGYAPLLKIGVPGDLTVANIGVLAFLKDDVGPWLWRPMQHVLPNKDEGKRFADLLLLDGFRDRVLQPLIAEFGDRFSAADFSAAPGTTSKSFWFDEIHPTESGFGKLAPVLNDAIRKALPAAKRTAIT